MAEENILDAENLINGSTVSPPVDISGVDTTPDVLNDLDAQIASAKAEALAIQDRIKAIAEEDKLAREKVDETTDLTLAKEAQKSWLEKIMTGAVETRAEVRAGEEVEEGVSEKEALLSAQAVKVAGTQGQIDVLEDRKQKEIDRAHSQVTAMGNINVAVREIERKYDSQKASLAAVLSGEAALMNAYQGNLDSAKANVTDAINDYMYDYDQEVKRYEFVYDYHSDWVDSLTTDQRTALDRAYQESQDVKDDAKKDLEYKQDLWTRAAEQGVYVPFSSLKDMTTEEAAKWYAEKVSAFVADDLPTLFSDSEIRELNKVGIDTSTPEGRQEGLDYLSGKTDWSNAEFYLDDFVKSIGVDMTQNDIRSIYNEVLKNTNLSTTEIKSLMATKGMTQFNNIWVYTPITTAEEIEEEPGEIVGGLVGKTFNWIKSLFGK